MTVNYEAWAYIISIIVAFVAGGITMFLVLRKNPKLFGFHKKVIRMIEDRYTGTKEEWDKFLEKLRDVF